MSSQALIDKIITTAENEAELITVEMLKRAGEVESIILSKSDAECSEIIKSAEDKAGQIRKTSALLSELDARKAALHAKREVMDEAYGKAFERLAALEPEKRTSFIRGLIIKNAPSPVITLTLTDGDRRYFGAEVLASLERDLSDKFGKEARVTVSDRPAEFRGGAFIESAVCDVDVSFEALFEELRRDTEAEVCRILFG